MQVNNSLVASHTPATADVNNVFAIVNGMLKVTTSTTNGTDYALNAGMLTSTATSSDEAQTREIDFIYDHNCLRTRKTVTENGVTTTYDYTLHGKLITHLTKRTVDENGNAGTEDLHFFYDAQNRPAFVKWSNAMYRYVHNLQGDIVGIVDPAGNLVVEYKYDAWGKPISTTGSKADTLGKYNLFRYRGYVWDSESNLFYLDSRYYFPKTCRFVSGDQILGLAGRICEHNLYMYCRNRPINCQDVLGYTTVYVNVYLKNLLDYGHVDISIDELTASYGRYGEVDEETGGLTGEGILVIDNYNKSHDEAVKKGRMIFKFVLEMNDEEIERLRSFYTNQMTKDNSYGPQKRTKVEQNTIRFKIIISEQATVQLWS